MVMGYEIFFLDRDQYKSYQNRRVGEVDDDRLKFEVSTMLSREVILKLKLCGYDDKFGC